MTDPFALPPPSPRTTRALKEAVSYIQERVSKQADARDIVKGLVQHHDAKLTYPSYRTALRCGGIYSEAASSCGLHTAKLLIANLTEKAGLYLGAAAEGKGDEPLTVPKGSQPDLFAFLEARHG